MGHNGEAREKRVQKEERDEKYNNNTNNRGSNDDADTGARKATSTRGSVNNKYSDVNGDVATICNDGERKRKLSTCVRGKLREPECIDGNRQYNDGICTINSSINTNMCIGGMINK